MKINLIQVGKTSFEYLKTGITLYENRIKKYARFSITTVKESTEKTIPPKEKNKKESSAILAKINTQDWVILLDVKGKLQSSESLAKTLEERQLYQSKQPIVFVIGGAYGFSEKLYQRANQKLSLSPCTFSHQIIRILFLEQLYRAFTIIHNEPYHHGS